MMEVWERNSSATGYLIDNRKRQDVVEQIEEMAISYTPEWKFNASDPDAASVIGLIFSNQLMESIKKLNQVLYKYHIEFANMYGVSRKPAIPARTICVLKVGEGMQSGAELKKNTHVVGTTEEGEEVTFAFLHDINAVSSELTDIVEASGIERKVVAHKGDFKAVDYHDMQLYPVFQEGQQSESVSMFSLQGKTIHKQAVVIYFGSFMEIQEQGIQLRFKGNHSSRKLTELFTNREYFTFSYITEEGITNFDEITAVGDFIEIKNARMII